MDIEDLPIYKLDFIVESVVAFVLKSLPDKEDETIINLPTTELSSTVSSIIEDVNTPIFGDICGTREIFQTCVTNCEKTCDDPYMRECLENEKGQSHDSQDTCFTGCKCEEDSVRHQGACIKTKNCPFKSIKEDMSRFGESEFDLENENDDCYQKLDLDKVEDKVECYKDWKDDQDKSQGKYCICDWRTTAPQSLFELLEENNEVDFEIPGGVLSDCYEFADFDKSLVECFQAIDTFEEDVEPTFDDSLLRSSLGLTIHSPELTNLANYNQEMAMDPPSFCSCIWRKDHEDYDCSDEGPNEFWNECGGCEFTCDQILTGKIEFCPSVCIAQCECAPGFVRGDLGTCVEEENCQHVCSGENKVWSECGGCDKTCESPYGEIGCLEHLLACYPKCVCVEGYFLNGEGDCVEYEEC